MASRLPDAAVCLRGLRIGSIASLEGEALIEVALGCLKSLGGSQMN